MIFGPSLDWDCDSQIFDLSGVPDILTMYLTKSTLDPFVITKGINQCPMPSEIAERVDRLLGSLESQQLICGNGTMLSLGSSVIVSRFNKNETKMILELLKARPLGAASIRYTPVYLNGMWYTLYFVKMQAYVLTVCCFMEVALSSIQSQLNLFETALIQSRLEIPAEETRMLLRKFAKRETLALLYHNIKSEETIFPAFRPGSESQQQMMLQEFWAFYTEASAKLLMPGVTEVSMVKDIYRFYARTEGIHKLFLLLANDSLNVDPWQVSSDILRNIKMM